MKSVENVMSEKEARYQAMADAYLVEKNPQRYYLLHREDDCCSATGIVALSDADLAEIQQLQKQNSDLPLFEVVEGTRFSDVITPDEEGLLPVELGTEPYYGCYIEIVDADVTREKRTHKTKIYMRPDSYQNLLAWKMDNRAAAFCHMAIEKPELAAKILDQLGPAEYMYSCFPKGFAIRLEEIDQDVYNMLGDESMSKELDEAIVSQYDCTNAIPAIKAMLEKQDISFKYVYWN